ncbi:hypothetical protein D9756_006767 [Leucocoprinus leucothites]|uniref:Uncharacterized protein n=1 Tax=Leucocoprinus leucothites TaxID=201217 RepID=A0A8H5G1Y2_9AGAR|nr:hypothetical protein D9756_006767 [Leucoagaricus leucothites]
MATATSHPAQSRFSRVGLNFGLRSHSELRYREPNSGGEQNEEDWFIPYTGTYEPPPEPRPSRNRDRDSWGDPIYGLGAGEASGDGPHVHYDDDSSDRHDLRLSEESRVRGRGRAQSLSSNYTASTGIDHGRASQNTQQRYHTTSFHRQPAPSYVNLDVGGVGESPVPHLRQPKERTLSHRGSLASIFTFGVKSPSAALADRGVKSPSRKRHSRPSTSSGVDRYSNRLSSSDHRRTASGDSNSHSMRTKRGISSPLQTVDSHTTTEEEYYDSYYSSLLQSPAKPRHSIQADPLSSSDTPPTSSSFHHPYAFAFPENGDQDRTHGVPTQPSSAPPTSQSHPKPPVIPKLTFSLSHSATSPAGPMSALPIPASDTSPQKQIKGSTSTPNLKSAKNTLGTARNVPKGIDRWLSAETWCDALLFPRPRLKIKSERSSSGRIVSPPGSPVLPSGPGENQQTASVPSRVLAHSRSLVNLREPAEEEELRHQQYQGGISLASLPTTSQARLRPQGPSGEPERTCVNNSLRPPRPKSWASDDLDLPSPVPSLARVLADGERLESDRREWQSKAAGSWGNKRARSISRARSRSLTAKGRKKVNEPQSSMDFLTARAVHGNQDVIPVLPLTLKYKRAPSSQQGTNSHSHSRSTSNTHTQTSSLIRSLTHSSKSASRDHSRNDSWSKTAIKAVKSTAPCFNNDATTTPTDDKTAPHLHNTSENALPKHEAQTTQLPDPVVTPVVPSTSLPAPMGPSPTPSNASGAIDPRIGIAISTPLTDESLDRENLRLASHPYAQGGLYSYTPPSPVREKRVEYAGPHPVQNLRPPEIPEGPAARHRLPPQAVLLHPYAQAHSPSRDSYDDGLIRHVRPDSDVPAPEKMWAPLAPGVVRELLPGELRYSPFIAPNGKLEGDMAAAMAMSGIVDTVGLGEALAYANEYQEPERGRESARDSGLGTSENTHQSGSTSREIVEVETVEEEDTTARFGSPSRIPVQYDVTRPSYRYQPPTRTPDTLHTFASSPLEHQYTPRMPEFIRAEMAALASPVGNSSGSSSQRNSPRPLGSPNDLVGFQDLFYKPGNGTSREPSRMASFGELSWNGSQTRLSNIPFDLKSSHQRPASGLTSLARKLSQEYERISSGGRESQYSRSSSAATGSSRPGTSRRPTDASLEFVFERPTQGAYTHGQGGAAGSSLPFEPQENVPEDVKSVSSSMETGKELEAVESEDETEVFHVKQVETATPAEVGTDHRLSYAGQLGFHAERPEVDSPRNVATMPNITVPVDREARPSISSPTESQARVLSGLQAPLSDNTRSSFYTTSTMSRMSGLSDFPVPPTNHRMSLLSAFFNEATGRPSMSKEDELPEAMPSRTLNSNNRLTFGDGADVEEIVEALSSQSSHS